jgi:hypothetical protein
MSLDYFNQGKTEFRPGERVLRSDPVKGGQLVLTNFRLLHRPDPVVPKGHVGGKPQPSPSVEVPLHRVGYVIHGPKGQFAAARRCLLFPGHKAGASLGPLSAGQDAVSWVNATVAAHLDMTYSASPSPTPFSMLDGESILWREVEGKPSWTWKRLSSIVQRSLFISVWLVCLLGGTYFWVIVPATSRSFEPSIIFLGVVSVLLNFLTCRSLLTALWRFVRPGPKTQYFLTSARLVIIGRRTTQMLLLDAIDEITLTDHPDGRGDLTTLGATLRWLDGPTAIRDRILTARQELLSRRPRPVIPIS